MQNFEHTLTARDGVVVRIYDWRPDSAPRGVVVATHGHGEYGLKYTHVAQAMTAGGYVWWGYDLRGHGYSGGPRGHVPRYGAYLSDLQQVLDLARKAHPGLPIFLYGHSMGGQITLQLKFQPPAWKMWLARALTNVAPTFAQETGLRAAIPMTHDLELLNAYPQPELRHSWMTARLGMEALTAGETAYEQASDVQAPLLILHGEQDGVFAFEISQILYDRARSADKTLHIYPGYYHEVHNEIGRAQVFADMLTWLDARV